MYVSICIQHCHTINQMTVFVKVIVNTATKYIRCNLHGTTQMVIWFDIVVFLSTVKQSIYRTHRESNHINLINFYMDFKIHGTFRIFNAMCLMAASKPKILDFCVGFEGCDDPSNSCNFRVKFSTVKSLNFTLSYFCDSLSFLPSEVGQLRK